MSESNIPKFVWFIVGVVCAPIFMFIDASWIMPVLFFGPLVVRFLCPTRLRLATHLHLTITFGLLFANPILVGVWAAVYMALDKVLSHWVATLLFWIGFIGIQGVIYGLAMRGTICAEVIVGLVKQTLQAKK